MQDGNEQNVKLGMISAIMVIFIWSGFVVFSRSGVTSNLTPYDITTLRFMVAGGLTLPFIFKWWPKDLPIKAYFIIALCGPGIIYSVLMYLGLINASAAYAAVFTNGAMPFFAIFYVYMNNRQLPKKWQVFGLSMVVVGALLLGLSGISGLEVNAGFGIILFLTASAILSFYVFALSHWKVKPKQALALVNIPSALIFIPVWYFFLPSTLDQAETGMIIFQALYQGLGPGFLAVILFSLSSIHLGPTITAGFSAAVPATAALLAIPVLGELPTPMAWLGIIVVSVGLLIVGVKR